MKIKIQKYEKELLLGSTFFGTGGGGSPQLAKKFYRKMEAFDLLKLTDLDKNDLCITIFGVGPSDAGKKNPLPYAKKAVQMLSALLSTKISGIIPVEIGPAALACSAYFSSILEIPLIDADFVGGRSAPEVYLETITLFNLRRTPLVAVSEKNNTLILKRRMSFNTIESELRKFSDQEQCAVYVAGYPLQVKELIGKIEKNTVSETIQTGKIITNGKLPKGTQEIFIGKVVRVHKETKNGFSIKEITIKNNKLGIAKLVVKNEYLGLYVNNALVVSCPDLLICFNTKGRPLYNTEISKGVNLIIYARKAGALWRSAEGVKLFGPSVFGEKKPAALLF